jgi:putative ABC transport system permease protein
MQQAAHADPGFNPSNVVTAQLRLSATVLPTDADRANFIELIVQRITATPGIVSAGTTLNPFTVGGSFQTMVHVEDRPRPDGQPYTVQFRRVSPGYFETMGIRLLSGRSFTRHDGVDSQPVAMISSSLARRFWPDQDPLGRRLKRGATAKAWSVIVGVVDDVRDVGLDQPLRDTVYSPYFQASNAAAPVGLVVRTAGNPAGAIKSIQRAVWTIDAKQPLGNITTLEQFMYASLGPQRFRAMLVTVCGVFGLLLATIGTYGVTARSVVERRREVGIRLALGGRARHVWWAVAKASLTGVGAGAAGGLAASAAARAVLGAMLPELRNGDWTFTVVAAGTLVLIGVLAVAVAARGVRSVDPLRAIGA